MHGFGGFWGMIAVGLFAREDKIAGGFSLYDGFFLEWGNIST